MQSLVALIEAEDEGRRLVLSPKLGFFAPEVEVGALLAGGSRIGTLRILNHRYAVILPKDVGGRVALVVDRPGRGVEFRGTLVELETKELALAVGSGSTGATAKVDGDGVFICAPIHGIFYSRPSPGAPPFALAGDTIRRGQTVGLIEVMKTFNPVVFEGPGVPESAVLVDILTEDQAEVEAGQPLLRWRLNPG